MGGARSTREIEVEIPVEDAALLGTLSVPPNPRSIVLFAHGSGSSRHSSRNQLVARKLHSRGLATLLLDLLTLEEEREDRVTAEHRFDIELLGSRVIVAADWLRDQFRLSSAQIGCFGASTGAAAALIAAAERPTLVGAVVSRGGRPDLAGDEVLEAVAAPTLLIVGGRDEVVIALNSRAFERLRCPKRFEIVPGATHLFEEPGALEQVAATAGQWFEENLPRLPVGAVELPMHP
jgi:putative phosphoribosyl transferase